MKHLLLVITLVSFTVFTLTSSSNSSVFICTGKYSKKYHYSKNCRGLSNCKSSVKSVSLQEAKNKNRTLCGWED